MPVMCIFQHGRRDVRCISGTFLPNGHSVTQLGDLDL